LKWGVILDTLIEKKGNKKNKITLTKSQLRIKIRDGASLEEETSIVKFCKDIYDSMFSALTQTLRGDINTSDNGILSVALHMGKNGNDSCKKVISFSSKEGKMNDPVKTEDYEHYIGMGL
jgi:hypothetical protein